jgi:hypothetical protein
MNNFNDRIAAQRSVLSLVNSKRFEHEQLFGLSRKAIERWTRANRFMGDSRLVRLLTAASEALFFLANHSQDHMTKDYVSMSGQFAAIAQDIEAELD